MKKSQIMKFFVNEGCIGRGLCAGTCPSAFSMTEDGVARAIDTDVPASALEEAEEAKNCCPEEAIEEA